MRFSYLTVLALVTSGAEAFSPMNVNRMGTSRNTMFPKTVVNMANDYNFEETSSGLPKKKMTAKEELLEEIERGVKEAEERRLQLEAELAAAEARRAKLLEEAERAAAIPDPPVVKPRKLPEIDMGVVGGAAGIIAGGIAVTVGARTALEARSEKQEEEEKKREIAKLAAEQDALNRAAHEEKKKKKEQSEKAAETAKKVVSIFIHEFNCSCERYDCRSHSHTHF